MADAAVCSVGKSGSISVRRAAEKDRGPLRDICRGLHGQSVFADIAFSDAKFDVNFDRALAAGANSVLLAAECGGRVVGGLWASAGEYFIGEGRAFTTVHVLAVDQQGIGPVRRVRCLVRLVSAAKAWGRTQNAEMVLIHVTTGHRLNATDRILRSTGATIIGAGYLA